MLKDLGILISNKPNRFNINKISINIINTIKIGLWNCMPQPTLLPKYLNIEANIENIKKVLTIPKTIEILPSLTFKLFFDFNSCIKLFIFNPKTGRTHGIKFRIKPPMYEISIIKNKLRLVLLLLIR